MINLCKHQLGGNRKASPLFFCRSGRSGGGKMRKRFTGFLILFLLFAGIVFAEGQVDPTRPQMLESLQMKQKLKEEYHNPGAADTSRYIKPTIEISGSKQPGKTLTFTAAGVSGAYEYWWGISDEGRDPGGYIYYPNHDNLAGKNKIKYKFYSAGTYSVTLFLVQNDMAVEYSYTEFTIKDDTAHPTLEEKAQEIVNECKASTKWQTALNLHDWLTHHAYYDASLDTHGADILFLGYGVCDSYSKAYELLCKTAGIPVERTFGPNHAWNTVKLDGKWYQVDTTWDDPGDAMPGQGKPVSGYEGHEFFCLSAALMKQVDSHTMPNGAQEGAHAAECTSMDANYYIHEKLYENFYDNGGTYVSQIQKTFNEGGSFRKKLSSYYVLFIANGSGTMEFFSYPFILGEILKTGLLKHEFTLNGTPVKVKITVSKDLTLTARITGWNNTETGTLNIPEGTTSISASAFYHHAATRVILPEGCGTIESKAFADSAVRVIVIPGPVISIAYDAFTGCENIMFISNDKKVKVYAARYGFSVIEP